MASAASAVDWPSDEQSFEFGTYLRHVINGLIEASHLNPPPLARAALDAASWARQSDPRLYRLGCLQEGATCCCL